MIDLDALVPEKLKIRLGGVEYEIHGDKSMPLSAVFACQKFGENKNHTDVELVEFLASITPIPAEKLRGLTSPQLVALMGAIFPRVEEVEGKTPDPQAKAEPSAHTMPSGASSAKSSGGTGFGGLI